MHGIGGSLLFLLKEEEIRTDFIPLVSELYCGTCAYSLGWKWTFSSQGLGWGGREACLWLWVVSPVNPGQVWSPAGFCSGWGSCPGEPAVLVPLLWHSVCLCTMPEGEGSRRLAFPHHCILFCWGKLPWCGLQAVWGEEKASSSGSLVLLGQKTKSKLCRFWLQGSQRFEAAVFKLNSRARWRQVEKAVSKKPAVKVAVPLPDRSRLGHREDSLQRDAVLPSQRTVWRTETG